MFSEKSNNDERPKPPTVEQMRDDLLLAPDNDVIFTSMPKIDVNSGKSSYLNRLSFGNETECEQLTSSDLQAAAMLDNSSTVPAQIYDEIKHFVDDNQKMVVSIPNMAENLQKLHDVASRLDEDVAAVRSQTTSPIKKKHVK